jgi:hypothetical protein
MARNRTISNRAIGRAVRRFFFKHFVNTQIHVVGDAIAVYRTFQDYDFCANLVMHQFARKMNLEGVKQAGWSFLLNDPLPGQFIGKKKLGLLQQLFG